MASSSAAGRPITGRASEAALREGFDYQDVYGWHRCLDLIRPARGVLSVSIADPKAKLFDDVTVRGRSGDATSGEFVQVKFHVAQDGEYSSDTFCTPSKKKSKSLLEKAWEAWLALKDGHSPIEIVLATTYAWDPDDPIARHIREGLNYHLTPEFIDGRVTGATKTARNKWKQVLNSPDEKDFSAFLASLRLRVKMAATSDLMDWTSAVMSALRLKEDRESVEKGARQVKQWILEGRREIVAVDVNDAIDRLQLREPGADDEPAVSLFVHTIVREPSDVAADFELDWMHYFVGDDSERGHAVIDAASWNDAMLPELLAKRDMIRDATPVRHLRLSGKSRLSAWFAVGWAFMRPGGWTLEVDQNGKWWRNDAVAAPDVRLEAATEDLAGDPDTIAVGISLTGDLSGDVRRFLENNGGPAGKLLLVRSSLGLGQASIRDGSDLVAVADQLREAIRDVQGRTPKRALLFYWGPLAGAAFIGAALNAVAAEIQVYENQDGSYAPSFTLKQK